MKRDLIELLFELIRRALRSSLTLGLAVVLSGCEGESGTPVNLTGPGVSPSAKSVVLKRGSGFECFILSGGLFCRGVPANADLRDSITDPTDFQPAAVLSGSDFVDLWTWDDTLCVSANVSLRPSARSAGVATYCWGEATLNGVYSSYAIVYGGPTYSHGVNGTPELAYVQTPFMGGDLPLVTFATQLIGGTLIVADGSGAVSSETLSCSQSGAVLTCPTFSAAVGL